MFMILGKIVIITDTIQSADRVAK